jgi:hypothetical protein
MSIAFYKSGVDVSGSNKYRTTHVHRGDKIIHQPSAAAFADWLSERNQLGAPEKLVHLTGEWSLDYFKNKAGILYFAHSYRGGTGPGHIDVLSGGRTQSGFYPNKVIWFWEYKNGSYGN